MKSEKHITKILITAISIIILSSFEAFIKGKSLVLFNLFQSKTGGDIVDYLNFIMLNYFLDILEPLIISLFLVFATKKLQVNRLVKFVLGGMVVAKLVLKITKLEFNSIFFYLEILLYLLFFYFIITIPIYSEDKNEL
ncbi:hypothetical protein WKS98_05785 [Lagierella sp. ICN-221743]